jgi:hypothetical protein
MISMVGRSLIGLVSVFALASCGGGGDIAGDSTEFTVSPKEVKLTVVSPVKGDCSSAASSAATVITIIGGQAPFRVVNAFPDGLVVDKTEVSGKDTKFSVKPRGGCGDPFIVTVLDYHSRVVTVEYTVESEQPEEEATTP